MGLFDEYIPISKFDYITKIPAFIQAVGAYVLGLAAADHTHAEGDGTTIITRTNSPPSHRQQVCESEPGHGRP